MHDDLKRLFRQSLEAFRSEVNANEPEDQVSALLTAMRKELVAAKAAIPEHEREVERVRRELGREREFIAQCERRAAMAEKIGDAETARVAREFAARHAGKVAVLEQKLAAAEAELALRRAESEEMTVRYREADADRFGLVARIRLANARHRARPAGADSTGFEDFDRMADRVSREADTVDARIDLDGATEGSAPPPRPPVDDVDERLRELKRRMGKRE